MALNGPRLPPARGEATHLVVLVDGYGYIAGGGELGSQGIRGREGLRGRRDLTLSTVDIFGLSTQINRL